MTEDTFLCEYSLSLFIYYRSTIFRGNLILDVDNDRFIFEKGNLCSSGTQEMRTSMKSTDIWETRFKQHLQRELQFFIIQNQFKFIWYFCHKQRSGIPQKFTSLQKTEKLLKCFFFFFYNYERNFLIKLFINP